MNNNWFIIKNLKEFTDASRKLVFNNFGSKLEDDSDLETVLTDLSSEDQKELDEVLSYNESVSIIRGFLKKQKNKKTKATRYLVDEKLYISIITALNDRLVSNILNSLVNKGLIETAYDAESNDFVFWCAKNDQEKNKPETN